MKEWEYVGDKLINGKGQSVMMGWEKPIMKKVAEIISSSKGDVLNIGFGMGIVDTYISEYNPNKHVIVENNQLVYDFMLKEGWNSKPNTVIYFDRWQNLINVLGEFDGIYLDTWADNRLKYTHELLDKCLKKGGKFSMWYNQNEFDEILKNLNSNYVVSYEFIENNNIIPPAKEQYENGGFYIDPNLEYITIPVIQKI